MANIFHKIGHILIGYGHPDHYDPAVETSDGPAPLPGTAHPLRLMCSGLAKDTTNPGILLVKKEWDEADEWLEAILPPERGGSNTNN